MYILIEEDSIIHIYPNLIQILVEVMYTNLRHILFEEGSILQILVEVMYANLRHILFEEDSTLLGV